jgi:hypothetical protein
MLAPAGLISANDLAGWSNTFTMHTSGNSITSIYIVIWERRYCSPWPSVSVVGCSYSLLVHTSENSNFFLSSLQRSKELIKVR